MVNESLVEQIQNEVSNRDELLMELWTQNFPMVKTYVYRYWRGEFADGLQESFVAMMRAVETYKSDCGANFLTYYLNVLRNHFFLWNDSLVYVPQNTRQNRAKVQKAETEFLQQYERMPTDEELSSLLGIPLSAVELARQAERTDHIADLDSPVKGAESLTLAEIVTDGQDMTQDVLDDGSAAALVSAVESVLSPEEAALLFERAEGLSLEQIGKPRGWGYGMAGYHLNKITRKLKRSAVFMDALPEGRYYRGGLTSFRNSWCSVVEREALELF